MVRPRTIAIGALALLLAAAPFIPRGDDDEGAIQPSGGRANDGSPTSATSASVGRSPVTPELRAEIDRVVAAGRSVGRVSAKQSPERLVDDLVRCADLEGQRYCLGTGWTHASPKQVRARMRTAARAVAARPAGAAVRDTGDLDPLSALQRSARMSPSARAAADRAELTMAARSVAKVWLLRHEIEGVALPRGFLADHPEARVGARTTSTPASATVKRRADYPSRSAILDPKQVAEQSRTYWCGPASMQMLAWGWRDRRQGQRHWARVLGTTTNGTGITDIVRVVNQRTGWDRRDHAGPYVTLDISGYSFAKWMVLMMRHIHDYRAPVVLHPVLQKRFYPYLDDDASGHFQVGRGYRKRGDRPDQLGYFEPWNQQRFDPSEPYISRVQWRNAYRSYRANQAHFGHNVGV